MSRSGRARDERGHGGFVAHVESQGAGAAAAAPDLGDEGLQRLDPPGRHDDLGALATQHQGEAPAQPRRRPGHQRGPPAEIDLQHDRRRLFASALRESAGGPPAASGGASRRARLETFPVAVRGRAATNRTDRGYL